MSQVPSTGQFGGGRPARRLLCLIVCALLFGPYTAAAAPALSKPDVTAVVLSVAEISVAWSVPASDAVSSFTVRRDGAAIASVPAGTFEYTDTAVGASKTYSYTVESVGTGGKTSAPSKAARATTPEPPERADTLTPTPPEEVTAATTAAGTIYLDWYDANDESGVTAYRIWRNGKRLVSVPSGALSYTDTQVKPDTSYTYVIEALDVVGHRSKGSRQVSATSGARVDSGASPTAAPALVAAPAAAPAVAVTYAAQLRRYPYLTDVSGPNATINWATDRSGSTSTVKWSQVAPNGTCTPTTSVKATRTSFTVNSVGLYQFKANLTLAAGTQYCYRVYLGNTDLLGSDASPRFWTQVPAGANTPFTFAVFGDWGAVDQNGVNQDQANVMSQIAASGARFAMQVGDQGHPTPSHTNYGDLVQTGSGISAVFGPSFWKAPGATMPMFAALGNHDMSSSSTDHPYLMTWPQDRTVDASGGKYVRETYCCTNGTASASYPSSWYAFNAGNARFYVLSVAWADNNIGTATDYKNDYDNHWQVSKAEYQWLAGDLAANPSALKFVFWHFPMYSDNNTEPSDTFLQGPASLEGLLSQYGAQIAFNGHSHAYQRNIKASPNSLVTYVTGGGGAKVEPIGRCSAVDAYAIGWSFSTNGGLGGGSACGAGVKPTSAAQVYHYLKVSVSGTTVKVTPINSLGQVFDEQTYNFGAAPTTGTISGTVTDGAAPLSGATVSYSGGSTTTNASGSYTLTNVAAGTVSLTASKAGYTSQTASVSVTAGSTSTQNFSLAAVPTTGTISGSVTDAATNAPLGGATVSYSGGSTTTDAGGSYTLTNVAPGSVSVTAAASGYTSQTASVGVSAGSTSTQSFSLSALPTTGTISGSVTDGATNAPLSGATVSYSGGSTTTDASGSYTLTNVAAGTPTVTAAASGYGSQSQAVTVTAGATSTQNFSLAAAPTTGTITGTVIDGATNAPLSGATVSYSGGSTTTDAGGSYTLANISAGEVSLTASAAGYTSQTVSVSVSAGSTSTQNFSLAAVPTTGTISGTVTNGVTSAALSGATVSYSGGSTTTNAGGGYTLTGVAAGSVVLTASAPGFVTQSQTVAVTAGATSTQNFALQPNPRVPIFADGFETGNMTAWTSSAGLTPQTSIRHAGTYAAQANTTTGNTYAKKTLPATYADAYSRIYFNIVSMSSQVNLLRTRTAADGSLAYLFVSTSGKLSLRNDVAATTTTSATSVTAGWHALELHSVIAGTGSTTEVWLDGVRINDLSLTTNLGTTPIGRLQIGEVMSGRTYNVVFDDVVFDTVPIGP